QAKPIIGAISKSLAVLKMPRLL
ncbi:microbial collagenase, partial [Vibrio parahaemolyticus AQ3810]